MVDPFAKKNFTLSFDNVLPDTEKARAYKAKKDAEERRLLEEDQQAKKRNEDREQKQKAERQEQERQARQEEQKRKEEERRRKEEEEQKSKLEGRLEKFLKELSDDTTASEFSLAGLNLGPVRCRILANHLEHNKSLKGLHMCRKKIGDEEGVELTEKLKANRCLQKLELEGNTLGPNTARKIGELLKVNDQLRVLDLEGNNLTNGFTDKIGFSAIAEALKTNKTLLSLNLCTCALEEQCGQVLVDAMQMNNTLIHLDVTGNKLFLSQIREIKAKLEENKRAYDEERFREWEERKRMREEQEATEMIGTVLEQEEFRDKHRMVREKMEREKRDKNWQEETMRQRHEELKAMEKLVKAAKIRAEASGKRRKKKKPAKK